VEDLIIRIVEQLLLITPDENGHHDKYGFGVISPINIHTELFPPEIEEPNKGGCSTLASSSSPVMFSQLLSFLVAWMIWVRRK
jgi:hypothetical protein